MSVLTLQGEPINWDKPPAPTTKVMWSRKDKSGRKVTGSFRTICHIEYLDQQARREFGKGISILQPPYNKGYKPSAGTHDYDACLDVEIPGVGWLKQQGFFRRHGLGCWWRKPPTFIHHIHGFTLPPQEGVDRADDYAILGFTVGKYIDGGWSLYGRKIASAQLTAYYNKRSGLKGNAKDSTWYPPSIKATIFDLSAFVKAQRGVVGNPPPRKTYTVRSGDTLGSIAQAHGVTWQQVAAWSKVKNPDLIQVGDVLVVSA